MKEGEGGGRRGKGAGGRRIIDGQAVIRVGQKGGGG